MQGMHACAARCNSVPLRLITTSAPRAAVDRARPARRAAQLFACATETISLNLDTRTAGAIPPSECPRLALVSVHPDRPKAGTLRYVTATCGDFPTLNPAYVGRRSRYAYVACMVTGFGSAVK